MPEEREGRGRTPGLFLLLLEAFTTTVVVAAATGLSCSIRAPFSLLALFCCLVTETDRKSTCPDASAMAHMPVEAQDMACTTLLHLCIRARR